MLDMADSVVIGGAFRWRWSWRMGMGKLVERIGTKKGRMGWEDVLDGVYHFCFWVHEKSRVFFCGVESKSRLYEQRRPTTFRITS